MCGTTKSFIVLPWIMKRHLPEKFQDDDVRYPDSLVEHFLRELTKPGDIVFDPFAGVGTAGVVAKKLKRNFVMVEIDQEYCLYAEKRLQMAEKDSTIQGYYDGVFWERNTLNNTKSITPRSRKNASPQSVLIGA